VGRRAACVKIQALASFIACTAAAKVSTTWLPTVRYRRARLVILLRPRGLRPKLDGNDFGNQAAGRGAERAVSDCQRCTRVLTSGRGRRPSCLTTVTSIMLGVPAWCCTQGVLAV
jgi:hypothetical protein